MYGSLLYDKCQFSNRSDMIASQCIMFIRIYTYINAEESNDETPCQTIFLKAEKTLNRIHPYF